MSDQQKSLAELIPDGWFSDNDNSSFWVTGYQVISGLTGPEIKKGLIFDFDQARVLIFQGQINYPLWSGTPCFDFENETLSLSGLKYDNIQSPEMTWLLILQPHIKDGVEQPEYLIKRKASSIIGLYTALNNYNMAYQKIFDFENDMTGKTSNSSPVFINPNAYPKPNLSKDYLNHIASIGNTIDNLPSNNKRRIELALHWFETGLRSPGLDGFIKYWVALETIAMPDTNIKPINEQLANIYDIDIKDIQRNFGIGKIQNMRSRILHGGEDLSVHQDLSRYMEALFLDILLNKLGVTPQKRSLEVLKNPAFKLDELTHIKTKRKPL